MKLSQIVKSDEKIRSKTDGEITELYHTIQKPGLFNGFQRTYVKNDEAGEDLPSEANRIQFTTSEVLSRVERSMSELMNFTALKDYTNAHSTARADVMIYGRVLVKQAPVPYLLFLEKKLVDLRTFVSKLPVLDGAENWTKDENTGHWKTDKLVKNRTKKTQKPIVLYHATEQHPAQTQMITEDEVVGQWHEHKVSGAIPRTEQAAIMDRIQDVLLAVIAAREQANSADAAETPKVGSEIFGYILGKNVSNPSSA